MPEAIDPDLIKADCLPSLIKRYDFRGPGFYLLTIVDNLVSTNVIKFTRWRPGFHLLRFLDNLVSTTFSLGRQTRVQSRQPATNYYVSP